MIALRAARVLVDGEERRDHCVTIHGGRIEAVGRYPAAAVPVIDLGELELIPGLVDLHSDCLEERAHPRPGREQPLLAALLQLDAEVVAHGVTTHFLCATMEDDPLQHRSTGRAEETVRCLEGWRSRLRVDHRAHLRVELTSDGALSAARNLATSPVVGLVSYMHHTPGFGQFASAPNAWREIYASGFQGSEAELETLVADRRRRAVDAPARRADVAALAIESGAVLASHDDESTADANTAAAFGAGISEFPLSAEAAAAASRLGLGVVMGAPNAWRGGSHVGGLGARDVLAAGDLSALASDYHPPSLLAAAYALADARLLSWSEALALVTANPARLAGLEDRGAISPGLRADLIAVERVGGHPVVRHAWIGGAPGLGSFVSSRRAAGKLDRIGAGTGW